MQHTHQNISELNFSTGTVCILLPKILPTCLPTERREQHAREKHAGERSLFNDTMYKSITCKCQSSRDNMETCQLIRRCSNDPIKSPSVNNSNPGIISSV